MMCEACDEMEEYVDATQIVDADRRRITDAIRKMQLSGGSNFISGNDLIDVVFEQRKDITNIYKGWD